MRKIISQSGQISLQYTITPVPAYGQVLIQVLATPINHLDLTSSQSTTPVTPGMQGTGIVRQYGGGLLGWSLQGKRVSFLTESSSDAWAQFIIANAKDCIRLSQQIPTEIASCFFVIPLTALMLSQYLKEHQAVIQTGALWQTGKMLLSLCQQRKIPIINIVNSSQEAQTLRGFGAQYVLNSSEFDFSQQLSYLALDLKATCAFDCEGGQLSGEVLSSMPSDSQLVVYEAVSGQALGLIDSADFVFENKKIVGVNLKKWIQNKGQLGMWKTIMVLKQKFNSTLKTQISKVFELEEAEEAVRFYRENMSLGRVVLKP